MKVMKKILIGLFLIASLSVLGANSQSSVNMGDYYIVDVNLMTEYSKEKTEFKNKYIALSEKNDKKNLIGLLKKYIEKYPDDSYAYEEIGTDYSSLDNFKEAEKYYLKAIELGNDDTGLYSLALIYGDEDSLKLLNLTPDEKKAKIKIAEKYKKQLSDDGFTHGKLRELREHKQIAMLGNAYSIYKLAVHYHGVKNYKLSEKYARQFLEFDKENSDIINILAEDLFGQHKYTEAEKLLLPFAQKGKQNEQYLLAISYYYQNKLDEAEKWAKKVLETAKKDNDADNIKIVNHLLDEIKNK